MKIDLHVHSKYSKRPSEWILKTLGCPESFTEPADLYKIAKTKGMSGVTITDHNTIEGCLEIAHLDDTFISEEVTTYFPEDRCKLHVLVLNITEQHHREIQNVRHRVFDLVEYLNENNILHALAHPLYSVNGKLTLDHFEQCLLLFKNFELNGARSREQNTCLKMLLETLSSEKLAELADKHDLAAVGVEPWKKRLIAGSDDHSSLSIGKMYTEIHGAQRINDWQANMEGFVVEQKGEGSVPQNLAHNIYSIAYQFYRDKYNIHKYLQNDIVWEFLCRHLSGGQARRPRFSARINYYWNTHVRTPEKDTGDNFIDILRKQTHEFIAEDDEVLQLVIKPENGNSHDKDLDKKWFTFIKRVSDKAFFNLAEHTINNFLNANFLNLFSALSSAGAVFSGLAPYLISYSIFSDERKFRHQVESHFLGTNRAAESRVAHFTDTLYEINGVALTLKRQIRAAGKDNKDYTVITCDYNEEPQEGVMNFVPAGVYELPIYPEQRLFLPPFLEILDYCYSRQITNLHAATPGPLGIAALGIAKILRLPIVGTYHTALPQYADYLIDDPSITELMWKYVIWFYDQMDRIFVPSHVVAKELHQKGLPLDKLQVLPRGVDTEKFHPGKRNGFVEKHNLKRGSLNLLYVGRVSKEKNVQMLSNILEALIQKNPEIHLFIVGDGPYHTEMKASLANLPATFTGYLENEELASAYASCDLFVFPSTTDTFGNVVLEAQAAGLPVIVTDIGGPQENVIPGVTGLIVKGNDEKSLLEAITFLASDRSRLKAMGKAARKYVEERSFDKIFNQTWENYYARG